MINPNITVDDITMAVAGRTKKLCRNCRHVGSEQKIEIGSFVCNFSWCNLDECYVRQDNSCNDYEQKESDKPHIPAVPLYATVETIGHQGICHKCKFLNTDTMVCEKVNPIDYTMDKTPAIYHGIKYCSDFLLSTTTPGEITLEIEDPCKKKANELTYKNHWQRCENCKHYKCLCCYNPDLIYGRFVAKHGLCSKFELASGKKEKQERKQMKYCIYNKDRSKVLVKGFENEDVKLEPVPIEDVTITFQGTKPIVHCANCTFMSIEKDWCYFNKSVLLGSNSGVCTCENAKPRITMEHCKKCGWYCTGNMGCDGINGKIECPIAKDKPPCNEAFKSEPSCRDCLYYKWTELCSIANHFEICSDFRVV